MSLLISPVTLSADSLAGTIPSTVLGSSTLYVGTTAVTLNRASGSQTLTGINIDGNAATVTGITSLQVTSALGYTPYDSANPAGYIDTSSLSGYLPLSGGTVTGPLVFSVPAGVNGFDLATNDTWCSMRLIRNGNVSSDGLHIGYEQGGGQPTRIYGQGSYSYVYNNSSNVWQRDSGELYLHSGNYTSYSPSLTGSGASGTWGISITGSANSITGSTTSDVNSAALGTGTANSTTFLRGDRTWVTVSGGASVTNDTTTNSNAYYPAMSTVTSGAWTTAYVSSTKFYFNPSTGTLNSTIFNSLSDINAKENIVLIESALDKTLSLRGVEYTLKETKQRSIGVVAQEVEGIIPELVSTAEDGTKSVAYGNMVGLLIEAIKEQQAQIDELKRLLNSK